MSGHLSPNAPLPPLRRPGQPGTGPILGPMATAPDPRFPLWMQILADLRRRLAAGEFAERFPGDAQLVERYGVSRHTVREAVRRLQAEGLLERRRGQGTFVTGPRIEQPVGVMYSLFRSIEQAGAVQESVVRALEERRDDKAEAMLGCPGEPLVYLERLRLADGTPIALDCSWLPASLARPLLGTDFTRTALYQQLAGRCHVRLTGGWERIRPVLPERGQRLLLDIDDRQPVFAIERFAMQGDTPVEWRHGIVRGDRFAFVARWSADQIDTALEQAAGPV